MVATSRWYVSGSECHKQLSFRINGGHEHGPVDVGAAGT